MNGVSQAAATDIDRPTSAPSGGSSVIISRPSYANLSPALSAPGKVPSVSKAKGMQLGATKLSAASHMPAEWAEEAAAEAEAEESGQANPWGNDDLMDVNADQDDWSKVPMHDVVLLTDRPMQAHSRQHLFQNQRQRGSVSTYLRLIGHKLCKLVSLFECTFVLLLDSRGRRRRLGVTYTGHSCNHEPSGAAATGATTRPCSAAFADAV